MTTNLITVDLVIVPSFCNSWPQLQIQANGQTVWNDYVEKISTITFSFEAQDNNQITIKYINKRNGPDAWDTQIDQDGQIIQDQNAVLTSVRINRARCDWIIDSLLWNYLDGTQRANRGFMDQKGHANIEFPADVYEWIVQQRQKQSAPSGKVSSLDYKNIYIPQYENEISQRLITELEEKIKKLNV